MSRTYSNFLLFEDVLDNIPNTSPVMTQAVQILLNPITKIVSEDCGTLLGNIVDSSLELEGMTEVATGDKLTSTRIISLLSQGVYKFGVRDLHTCVSHTEGGICRTCYEAQYFGQTAPAVGTNITIPSSLIYQTDIVVADGYNSEYPLSQTSDDWYSVIVINQGEVYPSSSYTLGYDTITFNSPPALDSVTGLFTVHFFKHNTDPFQGFIAKTYSGALLGMQPLPTIKTLLRERLYETQFSDNFIALMVDEITPLKAIPRTYLEYLDKLHSRLEKVLLCLYLFAIYSNVEV
jgi:hypothetical protein